MITPNPIMGTLVHAIGGGAAACCYLPFEKVKKWSYESFWLVQAMFAWLIVPIIVGFCTVPDLMTVYKDAPMYAIVVPILLGALYGFGGMAFGFAIRNIGYSLTYTISIGISAVFGTIVPLLLEGTMIAQFTRPGGGVYFIGMMISLLGIIVCGLAGYRKERDLSAAGGDAAKGFNMKKGLALTLFAGVLSGVFGVALFIAKPVSEIAAAHGAGHFVSNAAQILPSVGCLVTNLIWFTVVSIKNNTLKELVPSKNENKGRYAANLLLSSFAGSLWYLQFLFLGMANVRMGEFEFAGWGLHMFMLIFFSFIIGLIMKEWKNVTKKTFSTLIVALILLLISFVVMTYGSMIGEGMV
ncbi:MAG: L-rhamnose/proton symporter RhaT [Rikenellaceae bacterium]